MPRKLNLPSMRASGTTFNLSAKDRESTIVLGKECRSHSVSWASNGKLLASAGYSPTVQVWNVESKAEVRTLQGTVESIHSVAWRRINSVCRLEYRWEIDRVGWRWRSHPT